jgi:hypothetical protein
VLFAPGRAAMAALAAAATEVKRFGTFGCVERL